MSTRLGLLMTGILVTVLATAVAGQVHAEMALRAAMEQETVKGDLRGAIAAYQKIVDGPSGDRSVRALALVRMAECYQKLGDAQARASFERVLKEFGDQPAAAQAKAALARISGRSATTPTLPIDRMLWKGTPSFFWFTGDVSLDGRYIAYIDSERERYDLAVLDLATSGVRTAIRGGTQADGAWGAVTASTFSPDGSQLAYAWTHNRKGEPQKDELRVASLSVGDGPKARVLLADPTIVSIAPRDWSRDGQLIAVDIERQSGARQVGVIGMAGGGARILKEVPIRRTSGMFFSPDSRYLLFDVTETTANAREIVGVDLRSGTEFEVVTSPGDDSLLGFTPDGKKIVFGSTRTGTPGIWVGTFTAARVTDAALINTGVRIDEAFGISTAGALYYSPPGERLTDLKAGTFDAATGRFTTAPELLPVEVVGRNVGARFSPDGTRLGYVSRRPSGVLFVIAAADGSSPRAFPLPLRSFRNGNNHLWRWSADGKGILAIGANMLAQDGIHYIDATTGHVAWTIPHELPGLSLGETEGAIVRYSVERGGSTRDFEFAEFDIASRRTTELYRTQEVCRPGRGRTFVYCVQGETVVRRDLAAKTATPVAKIEAGRGWGLSPDDRFFTTTRTSASSSQRTLWLTDWGTGVTRELPGTEQMTINGWLPGGQAVLANKAGATPELREVWWVPLDGRAPQRVRELERAVLANPTTGTVNRDGRIVFEVSSPDTQWGLRVMENFLPVR